MQLYFKLIKVGQDMIKMVKVLIRIYVVQYVVKIRFKMMRYKYLILSEL